MTPDPTVPGSMAENWGRDNALLPNDVLADNYARAIAADGASGSFTIDSSVAIALLDEVRAARRSPPTVEPGRWQVKPLEWVKMKSDRASDRPRWQAYSVVGLYGVSKGQWWRAEPDFWQDVTLYALDDDAKAAAQADHETRVRSEIVEPGAPAAPQAAAGELTEAWVKSARDTLSMALPFVEAFLEQGGITAVDQKDAGRVVEAINKLDRALKPRAYIAALRTGSAGTRDEGLLEAAKVAARWKAMWGKTHPNGGLYSSGLTEGAAEIEREIRDLAAPQAADKQAAAGELIEAQPLRPLPMPEYRYQEDHTVEAGRLATAELAVPAGTPEPILLVLRSAWALSDLWQARRDRVDSDTFYAAIGAVVTAVDGLKEAYAYPGDPGEDDGTKYDTEHGELR